MHEDKDFIYLAGLVDGEGCITGTTTRALSIRLEIHMTHEPVITWLQQTFGGKKFAKTKVPSTNKPVWMWKLADKEGLKKVLTGLKPYLKVKLPQALLALDIVDRLPGSGNTWKGDDQVIAYVLLDRIKSYNRGDSDDRCD